jgi:2',3'-cyclic-nucleotide 2'-phosphodiesterase (5'-nucleotidase family)
MVVTKPLKGSVAVTGDLPSAKGTDPADADGRILFGEAWNAFGYGNSIITVGVTGRQIQTALKQQWQTQTNGTVKFAPIAVSKNVGYTADTTKPVGSRVAQVLIDGEAFDPAKTYRLAVEAYTLIGGTASRPSPATPAHTGTSVTRVRLTNAS